MHVNCRSVKKFNELHAMRGLGFFIIGNAFIVRNWHVSTKMILQCELEIFYFGLVSDFKTFLCTDLFSNTHAFELIFYVFIPFLKKIASNIFNPKIVNSLFCNLAISFFF